MGEIGGIRGFIFDLDGVVYIGETPVKGAAETLNYLRGKGKRIRFVTNKSDESRGGYVRKLNRMGVECSEREVIPSSYGTAVYLKKKYGGGRCFVIGGRGVIEELKKHGFEIVSGREGEKADFVVVGIDRKFNYEKLKVGMRAVMNGAKFIATNRDCTKPSEDGLVPGAGAMIAALEACTGVKPEVVIGKPNRMLFEIAVREMGLKRKEVAVVGDKIDTDVAGGRRVGLYTILVLTGITKREDLRINRESKPDLVVESISELMKLF
ncbi:MAG: HAD-IIA family hydrolase [Candidatus Micrarchaeia archaeon]